MQPRSSTDRTERARPSRADVDAQRAETGAAGTVGPSTSPLPNSMTRGLWRGGAAGAVVGAIILLPLALIPLFDLSIGVRLVIALVAGAAAGAAVGAVFFGGAVAEAESDDRDNQGDESVVPDAFHRPDTRP
jgi:hypothetical protein